MADNKDKPKPQVSKVFPKDGQVIMAIMKEMGVTEYEPKTIVQLTEFVYRYGTTVLEEAKLFDNNKKKTLELDDIKLALDLQNESSFTMPPPREILLECARTKNNSPLPLIKPPCGLRLPPDRHCLSSANYVLKGSQKKMIKNTFTANKPTVNIIKRTSNFTINKPGGGGAAPKPVTKISTNSVNMPQKTVLKPKIQISQSQMQSVDSPVHNPLESLKRKREDGDEM